jgi:hypothetical protein
MQHAAIIYWCSVGFVVAVYVIYPLLLRLAGFVFRYRVRKSDRNVPIDLAVIMVARNQQERIKSRIQNLLASDYPGGTLRLVVVSDGSTDATARRMREIADPRIRVIEKTQRVGRSAALTAAMALCREADVLAFVDVELNLSGNTLKNLVTPFQDPAVGAVCGIVRPQIAANQCNSGVILQSFETFLRSSESRLDSVTGFTPGLYAVRKGLMPALSQEPQADYITVALAVLKSGRRAVLTPEAIAYATTPSQPMTGFRRKRRRVAALLGGCLRNPGWFVPWHNRLAGRFMSHEIVRLLTPIAVVALFVSNAVLLNENTYFFVSMLVQLAFYATAIASGFGLLPRRWTVCNVPSLVVSQVSAVPMGIIDLLTGRYKVSVRNEE